jgi:biopolymer transport protein ExbD
MKREDKFLVIKIDDINAALFANEKAELDRLCEKVRRYRISKGKNPSTRYVSVNQDEPYAEVVWKLIETFEDLKEGGKLKL